MEKHRLFKFLEELGRRSWLLMLPLRIRWWWW